VKRNQAWGILVAGCLAAGLFLRKPDSLLNAQFWAEEGNTFFLDAYNRGLWWTLARPTASYLNTFPRLVAGLAALLPLRAAPLVFNLAAFTMQLLPPLFLLSGRMRRWIPDRRLRVAAAAIYVLVPNSYETYVTLTNSQWHLAFCGLLLLTVDPPQGRWGKCGDLLLLLLFAFTGPFAIMVWPLALINAHRGRRGARRGWCFMLAAVTTLGATVQTLFILAGGRDAPPLPVMPTFQEMLRILSTHVALNSLLGIRGTLRVAPFLTMAVDLAGLCLLASLAAFVLVRRYRPLVSLLYLAVLTITLSFVFPTSSPRAWLWPDFAPRYYTFASLFVIYSIVLLIVQGGRLRWCGALLAAPVLCVAIPGDFAHDRRPDTHYADQLAAFQMLPAGTRYFIPLQPEGWGGFVLVKKSPLRAPSPLDAMRRLEGEPGGTLDRLATVFVNSGGREPYLQFSGWAADPSAKAPSGGVWVEIDGRLYPAVDGVERPDAELALGDPRFRRAGYYRRIPMSEVGWGPHQFSLIILTHDRAGYYRLAPRTFTWSLSGIQQEP